MYRHKHSKFHFPASKIEASRESAVRKNLVLIALASAMSIYASGLALATLL